MTRRHEDAAVARLAQSPAHDPVLGEALLGLAREWDRIETTGNGTHAVPNVANAVVRVLKELDSDRGGEDEWDQLLERTTS